MELRNEHYEKNTLKSVIKIDNIYTIHYFKYGKNFKIPAECHDFWEMVYIDSGEVGIIAGENQFTLKQGQAFFHKPNEVHNIYTDNTFGNSVILSFDCKGKAINYFTEKIFTFGEFEKTLLGKIVSEAGELFEDKLNQVYLTKMTKRQNAMPYSEQLIKNSIELLLISLMKSDTNNLSYKSQISNIPNKHSKKIVESIIEILNQHLYTSIDLDTIVKRLFFSKTYIKTVFKKTMGTSIIQYYIYLKIEESKKLISQQKYTYTEIAYMLGFNSVHYFSRLFKAHTDMTPSEYSKSIKYDNIL